MVYLLFAVTTGLTALILLFIPAVRELREVDPTNVVAENSIVSYITFVTMTVLVAPIFIPIVMVDTLQEQFKDKLIETLRLK